MREGSLSYYLELLSHLDKEMELISGDAIHSELVSITRSIVEEVHTGTDIARLDQRASSQVSYDTSAIRQALEIIKSASLSTMSYQLSEKAFIDPANKVVEIEQAVSVIEENQIKFGRLEVGLRLEMWLDPELERVLICFNGDEPQIDKLKKLIAQKIAGFSEDDIMKLWGALQSQFGTGDFKDGFEFDQEVMGSDFFTLKNTDDARNKVADYVVRIKPQLLKRQLPKKRLTYPVTILGAARLLAIRGKDALEPLTEDDISLLRNLARLGYLWEEVLSQNISQLINLLDLKETSFVASSSERREFEKELQKKHVANKEKLIIHLLRKLISYASLYAAHYSPIEKVLYRYKLGLEVLAPTNRKDFLKYVGNEETVQRYLCKHLIEHGVNAFGTKFGRSEIDLLCGVGQEAYVVETKVISKGTTPRALAANLVQLQSYMSQQVPTRRGVLLIYNLSDVVIGSLNKWIKGRYWILAINLCPSSPSKRNKMIEIKEGTGEDLIECFTSQPALPKTRTKRTMATRAKR